MRRYGQIVHTLVLVVLFAATPFILLIPILQQERFSSALNDSFFPLIPRASKREPPEIVRGIYLTANTAESLTRREALFNLVERTELNAVVIDIKDAHGFVAYETDFPFVVENGLLASVRYDATFLNREAHRRDIWTIARLPVFEDPALVEQRPGLALRTKSGDVWKTRRGTAWLDTTQREVWKYAAILAKDAAQHGFDEVQFDYVRFPSDGALSDAVYMHLENDAVKYPTIAEFFRYLREELGDDAELSADLFGMTMVRANKPEDDLRIGQRLVDALPVFNAVSPMTYPSHYPPTFEGFRNPAEHPGEIVSASLDAAKPALHGNYKKIRPWLQDFNLGAKYTPAMVRAQIDEAERRGVGGWLLWNPANRYTEEALNAER